MVKMDIDDDDDNKQNITDVARLQTLCQAG